MEHQEKQQKTAADEAIDYIQYKAAGLKRVNGKWIRLQEARLEKKVKRRFDRQAKWVVAEMAKLSFFKDEEKRVRVIERKTVRSEIDRFLEDLPEIDLLAKDIVDTARSAYKKGAKAAEVQFDMLKVGISFDLVNSQAVDYLKAKETLHLSNYRGSITRTTKTKILNILTDAAETGASYQKTGAKIMAQGDEGVFSRYRAEMIAVREVGEAYEEGNREMVDTYRAETGAQIQKLWITSGDDRVTEECAANEAVGWIGFDESFLSGDEAAPRASNPRCRCSTGYRQLDSQGNPI